MNEFKYISPQSLEKASNLLTEKNTYAYAGGTDALSLIKHYTISPEKVIKLKVLIKLNINRERDLLLVRLYESPI